MHRLQSAFSSAAALVAMLATPAAAQEATATPCTIDLTVVGAMQDILSNALTTGQGHDENAVNTFLAQARVGCKDGSTLLAKAAAKYGMTVKQLEAEAERFRHVNCDHDDAGAAQAPAPKARAAASPPNPAPASAGTLTKFAEDVTMHVVLHEIAHGLIREFDLPVLGNEETNADAFATHYVATYLPDLAVDVLRARVDSLMFEAREVPRDQWTVRGEHNSDARRAYQIAGLAVAVDIEKFAIVGRAAGMSAEEMRRAADYGSEIHRSWRRVLRPLWLPHGTQSTEARVRFEVAAPLVTQLRDAPLAKTLEAVVKGFDWHSQVTLQFVEGDGGAAWNRSRRTITVNSGYVQRFIDQGAALKTAK